ncbi:MAG: hypothetical protein HXY34_06075 [Candidatus Thorarchaeota archaeon]|nr:hypothetical protein [Candidatus Thorarchaeota archaeon]
MSSNGLLMGRVQVEIDIESDADARIVYDALFPETVSAPSERARTTVQVCGPVIRIDITAQDLASLRAATNSFLSWISACERALQSVANADDSSGSAQH